MATITKDEILSRLRRQKDSITRKYPVKSLALFGSYAREDENPKSDIDLLVEFNGPIGWEIVDLVEELEMILGVKNVDLVSERALKPHYRPYIEKDLVYV